VSEKRVNWQPISALSLIGSMIDSLLDEMENHYANLQACRLKPHVLDNDTVSRVIQVYSAQADDVWLFETQLYRWRNLNLTPAQREEVDRLAVRIPTIRERITAILALAQELRSGTIDAVLAKSDLEGGLEFSARGSREAAAAVLTGIPPNFGACCFYEHEAGLAP
jgi:hypothetical protein